MYISTFFPNYLNTLDNDLCMIERKIYKRLEQWKERVDHKPLLVKGQRQVGKSFIIEEFAKNDYGNYIILDFNTDKAARKLFKDSLDPDSIVRNIEQYTDKRVNGRDTLPFAI